MTTIFGLSIQQFLDEQEQIAKKNQDKIDQCIKIYKDAAKYPRKKKKAIRRLAHQDYQFWMIMSQWHNNIFKF